MRLLAPAGSAQNRSPGRPVPSCTVALLCALVLSQACKVSARPGYIEDDKKATVEAIDQFHHRQTKEQFEDIYRDAHQVFKATGTQEQLVSSMRATRDKYGAFKTVTFSQLKVFVKAPVEIRAVYNTTFERGEATEQFIFLRDDGHVRLAFYTISAGSVRPGGNAK